MFPPVGVPHPLDLGDRQSTGVFFLRQVAPDAGRYPLRIAYHVEYPAHLRVWARTIQLELLVEGERKQQSSKGTPSKSRK